MQYVFRSIVALHSIMLKLCSATMHIVMLQGGVTVHRYNIVTTLFQCYSLYLQSTASLGCHTRKSFLAPTRAHTWDR